MDSANIFIENEARRRRRREEEERGKKKNKVEQETCSYKAFAVPIECVRKAYTVRQLQTPASICFLDGNDSASIYWTNFPRKYSPPSCPGRVLDILTMG